MSGALVSGGAIKVMGRYALFREIAAGGMAVVHLGRLQGPVGFSRTVAIKRLYPQYARDPEFVSMFLDEARLAARVRHPNVVPTLDVVASSGELFLVMDYVHGDSLARLVRAASERRERLPPKVILAIVTGALGGLHSAHEARGARGEVLGIVHRDVSPQNILVGSDGVARIVDFGVAKAAGRVQTTRDGQLKGKIGYFAPEQISGTVTRKTDIFAMSIVLWEALTGRRLFRGENDATTLYNLLHAPIAAPSTYAPEIPPGIDAAVLRGLERDPAKRFDSARDMALELERHIVVASPNEVGAWVERLAQETLSKRAVFVAEVEGSSPDIPDDSVEAIMRPSRPPEGERDRENEETISGSVSMPNPRRSNPQLSSESRTPPGNELPAEMAGDRASRPPAGESTSLSVVSSLGHFTKRRTMTWVWMGAAAAIVVLLVFFLPRAGVLPGRDQAGKPLQAEHTAPPDSKESKEGDTPAAPTAKPDEKPIEPGSGTGTGAVGGSGTGTGSVAATPPGTPSAATKADATPPKPQPRKQIQAPPPPSPKPAARDNGHCAVPYTLDATGRKKWKPECL